MLAAYVHSIFSSPVDATVNIALNKPAAISTQHNPNSGALNAVDGNRGETRCVITLNANREWLRIDLQNTAQVQKVGVKNRIGGFNRLGHFHITVGDSPEDGGRTNPYCVESVIFTAAGQFLLFHCSTLIPGRYVALFKPAIGFLEICEVEVYGFFDY